MADVAELPSELRGSFSIQPGEEFIQSWWAHEAWPVMGGGLVMSDGRRYNTIAPGHFHRGLPEGFFPFTWDGRLVLTSERIIHLVKEGMEVLNPTGSGFRMVFEFALEEVGTPTVLTSVHFNRAILILGAAGAARAVALDGRTHPNAVVSEIAAVAGNEEVGGAPQSSPIEIIEPASRGSPSPAGWVPPPEAGEGTDPQPVFKEPPVCPLCHQKMIPSPTGWDCPTGECEFSR